MRPAARFPPMMSQRGLSMVEIITGLVVAGFAVAIAYKTFLFFNSQAITQKRIAAGQSALLPVQDALEKNLRRAGYGIALNGPRLNGAGGVDTLASIEFADNGSLPDGLTVRGNFSGVASQLRWGFSRGASAMSIRVGDVAAFRVGDMVIVDDREHREYLVVQQVLSFSSQLRTGPRLYDYPAGAPVTKVNTVEFRPLGDSLLLISDGVRRTLARNLFDLRIYPILVDGTLDSVPPVPLDRLKSVEYRVRLRIVKAGGQGFLYRDAIDRVLLRNFQ